MDFSVVTVHPILCRGDLLCADHGISDKTTENFQKKNQCRLEKDDVKEAMAQNPNATEYVVPEGIAVIGEYAFGGLENLVKVTLPQSLSPSSVETHLVAAKI